MIEQTEPAPVPPTLLKMLRQQRGARVEITAEEGRRLVPPQTRVRYSLEEILARCDPEAERTVEEREWLEGEPVGKELI